MRLNTRRSGKHEYVYFLESYIDNKTKQPRTRTIKSFGRRDLLEAKDPDIMNKLQAYVDEYNAAQEDVHAEEVSRYLKKREEGSLSGDGMVILNYGIAVYRAIWDELDMDYRLKYLLNDTRIKYDVCRTAFLMSALRGINPRSKLATFEDRNKYILPFDDIKEQDLYKTLTQLAEYKDDIERHLHRKISGHHERDVRAAFYDVTTCYFESTKDDSLKKFGYSKDNKINEVQVVMGLLIDSDGIPISYDLYPGNTSEFKTLKNAIVKLRKQFKIEKVIVVADRGLNSKSNLAEIKNMGFEYVMAYKLKGATKEIKESLFSEDGYIAKEQDGAIFRHKVIETNEVVSCNGEKILINENLIITYSSRRAEKDLHDRERLIKKAESFIDSPSKYASELKKGGKGFIKVDIDRQSLSLDTKKICEQARFDGYYGIVTSDRGLTTEQVIGIHHGLWKIEESFRVMKSNLQVRPCFVWTEDRIKGHFAVCFIALVMQRLLEYRLREAGIEVCTGRIQEAIREAKVGRIKINDEVSYYIRCKQKTDLFDKMCGLFGMEPLCDWNRGKGIKKRLKLKQVF